MCVYVLFPLKLSVDKSSIPSDLKKHVCVCMWYVIMFQDHRYLESPIIPNPPHTSNDMQNRVLNPTTSS